MYRNKEDNVVFVLQKAIKQFRLKVTKTTIKETLLEHPHYPSLKSVCDSLKKWEVEHYPLNLSVDEIKSLEMPFIAHLKVSGGHLVFVEEIKKEKISFWTSNEARIVEDFDKFSEKLSGAVVVMDKTKYAGEKKFTINRQIQYLNNSLLYISIATILSLAVVNVISNRSGVFQQFNYIIVCLFALKLIGLVASIFLVMHELKVHTPLAEKICGFSSKTDCDAVLSSNASKLFGWINWADVGLIYFIGTLHYLTQIETVKSVWLLALVSIFTLPYPMFSIYYQAVKLKKWCPFCLTVQLSLIAEFIILLPKLKIPFLGLSEISAFIISFLLPTALWLLLKAYIEKSVEKDKEHYSFLAFKRKPEIFTYLLQKEKFVEVAINKNSLVLGNPEAPITITAFLSLNCNPCANAFKKIKDLLSNCSEVKVNTIFSVYDDSESKQLINTLYYIYNKYGNKSTIDFLSHWYSGSPDSQKELHEMVIKENIDAAEQIKEMNSSLFEKAKVQGTPTVYLNGYKFPTQYDYNDIEKYMYEIKNLNLESKRQEACANCN